MCNISANSRKWSVPYGFDLENYVTFGYIWKGILCKNLTPKYDSAIDLLKCV